MALTGLRAPWEPRPLGAPHPHVVAIWLDIPGTAVAHSDTDLAALTEENWASLEFPHPGLEDPPSPPDLLLAEPEDHTLTSRRVLLHLPGKEALRELTP